MKDDHFQLTNEPTRTQPRRFTTERAKQKVLFSGLDCLPGQQDLFATDGVLPAEDGQDTMDTYQRGPAAGARPIRDKG